MLRVETLSPRKLLAGDVGSDTALQYTGGATIPAETASRHNFTPEDLIRADVNGDGFVTPADALSVANAIEDGLQASQSPAHDINLDHQIDIVDFDAAIAALELQYSQPSSSASMGGGTELTSTCDAMEITLALLEAHLNDLYNAGAPQDVIDNVEASIAAMEANMGSCDGDDGSDGSTSGTTGGTTTGTTSATTSGSTIGTTGGTTSGSTSSSTTGSTSSSTSGTTGGTTSGSTSGSTTGGTTSGSTTGTTGGTTTGSTIGTTSGTTTGSTTGTTSGTTTGTTTGTTSSSTTGTTSGTTSGTTTGTTSGTTGGPTSGTTTGTTTGTTGGTTSGSSQGTDPIHVVDYGFHADNYYCDIDGDVEEGDGITVWAELEGDWDDTSDPDVEFKAFIGGQLLETEVVNIAYFGAYYAEMSFSVPDDGPDLGSGVWGNDTDFDDVTVEIIYEGLTDTLTIPVENLSPVFDQHAIVESEVNTAGDLSVSVSAISFYDPGVRDQHKVTVTWADDTTTEVPYNANVPITKTFTPTPANPDPAVYPIDILITDDDTETGGFRLDALELDFNGDDDDGNGILDRDDVMASLGDDDLVSIDLAPFLANIPPGEEGDVHVYYSFDSMSESYGEHGITRLWLDSNKSQTLTEATDDYGWVIPAGVTQFWVEGTNFGNDTLDFNWVPRPDDCTANYHEPVDLGVILVAVGGSNVDIDTDSNNNRQIDDTDADGVYEDDIEEDDLGKRIFVNIDDDNRNGIPDREDAYVPGGNATAGENDLARVEFATGLPFITDYRWMELRFTFDAGLRGWATAQKQGAYTPNVDGGGVYTIDLDGTDSAGFPNHLTVPNEFFVEGVSVSDRAFVTVELLRGTTVLSTDKIVFSVEKIVWPNQDPAALAALDVEKNTGEWNGFELNVKTEGNGDKMGWYISKSLQELILAGRPGGNGDFGYIRTEYPKQTSPGRWEGAPEHNDSAVFDLGTLFDSGDWTPGQTVVVTLEYEFEQSPNISTGQYVDATPSPRPGFFHNSGVKIENRAEVAIIDSQSIIDAIDNGHQSIVDGAAEVAVDVPGHNIDATGTVELQHGNPKIPWKKDAPNKLINEIPYGAGPNTEAALRAAALPGKVVIEITRKANNDKYLLKIDGVIWDDILNESGNPDFDATSLLIIQSHWGSGVKYTKAQVKK